VPIYLCRIDSVTEGDGGAWECIATNDVGNTTKTVSVRVNGKIFLYLLESLMTTPTFWSDWGTS